MKNLLAGLIATLALGCGPSVGHPPPSAPSKGDMATEPMVVDMAMLQAGPPDLAMAQQNSNMTGCGTGVTCHNNAQSQAEDDACIMALSPTAAQLYYNLLVCVFGNDGTNGQPQSNGACNDFGGGTCDQSDAKFDQTACDACLMAAQAKSGKCYSTIQACFMNCVNDSDCQQGTCSNETCG